MLQEKEENGHKSFKFIKKHWEQEDGKMGGQDILGTENVKLTDTRIKSRCDGECEEIPGEDGDKQING
jgi:hypothetical protein